jgi:hypothetical protein
VKEALEVVPRREMAALL